MFYLPNGLYTQTKNKTRWYARCSRSKLIHYNTIKIRGK